MPDDPPNPYAANASVPTPPPIPLDLAPLPKSNFRYIPVLAWGFASTALALLLVYLLQRFANFNAMGYYVDYLLPFGAIGVGLLASAGYGLAARWYGLKIRRGLLLLILAFQVTAYFQAKYVEFWVTGPFVNDAGHVLNFAEYFDLSTRSVFWEGDQRWDAGAEPHLLGGWGYGLRFGEICGFALGTLIAPLLLMKASYCELCERYMKTKRLISLPAMSKKSGNLFGKKAATLSADEITTLSVAEIQTLTTLATAAQAPEFAQHLAALTPQVKGCKTLGRLFQLSIVHCPQCATGHLNVQIFQRRGRNVSTTALSTQPLAPQFLRDSRALNII